LKPLALVCDDSINGLGIVRSLATEPAIEIVALARQGSITSASQLVSRVLHYEDPDHAATALSLFLAEVAPRKVVPFPGSDRMLLTLSAASTEHANLIFLDSPEEVSNLFSKVNQYEIADSIGLATPPWYHHRPGDTPRPFDNVVKAVRPADRLEQVGVRSPIKMAKCDTKSSLDDSLALLSNAGFSSLVSDFVDGPETNLFTYGGYVRRGEVVADFVGRKLWHTYPTRVAAVAESTQDREVQEQGRRFVEAVGLSGLFQVELKRSSNDGELYLIEMNQRNWLWGQLATACGSNLPVAKYKCEAENVYPSADADRRHGVYINEYGVISNIWGYKTLRPLLFAARTLVSRRKTTMALFSRRDVRPVWSAIRSALPSGRG